MKSLLIILILSSAAFAQFTRPTTQPAANADPTQEIAGLRAQLAVLTEQNAILSSYLHCLSGHGVEAATATLIAADAVAKPVVVFESPRELLNQHPMIRKAKQNPLSDDQKQVLFATTVGHKLRITMIPKSVSPMRGTAEKNAEAYSQGYISVKSTVDDGSGLRCEVDAWFPKEMFMELVKIRGQTISIEGTIGGISYSPGAKSSSMTVRLKDCTYGKPVAAKNLDL